MLAAGHSRRFGPEDKLLADLGGRPLVAHAAEVLRRSDISRRVAVVSSEDVAAHLEDFECVFIQKVEHMQSDSLRAGIARAREGSADRALITLGDMPLVSAELIDDVLSRCSAREASASTDGQRWLPPACFPKALFETLLASEGDKGAAPLLRGLPDTQLAPAAPETLIDIDVPADLERLRPRD